MSVPLSSSIIVVGSAPSITDDSAPTSTANTRVMAKLPPPKADKPRPYVCSTCQRSFARLEHLKRHERSHTKEKPFECPECSRCFSRRDLQLRHQQKLHQTSIPSSPPRSRRDFATSDIPKQSRARKNSSAGPNSTASNALATPMMPQANAITDVDNSAIEAAANASIARGISPTHTRSRHRSRAGSPIHSLDHVFGGIPAAVEQRRVQHELPRLETHTSDDPESSNDLRTALTMAATNAEFDFEDPLFGLDSVINPNSLHYKVSPQSMALEHAALFASSCMAMPLGHTHDSFQWLTGLKDQISFHTNEDLADGSSASAFSTTSQNGIGDVILDGPNHLAQDGTSAMWQPAAMDPLQISTLFAMDLNGPVFPALLNVAPLSREPAFQEIDDPCFSTHPSSLSLLTQSVVRPLSPNAGRETLSSFHD